MIKQENSFTVLELLFVITIISLLAAIMFPLLAMSKEKARKSSCTANLNQIGITSKLYMDEQGSYPDGYLKVTGGILYWCGEYNDASKSIDFTKSPLHDYLKDSQIFICPSMPQTCKSLDSSGKKICSYGINIEYVGGSPEPNPNPSEQEILDSPAAKSIDIKSPDRTLFFMDSACLESGSIKESYYFWARYFFTKPEEHEARSHFRHNKVAVGVFCDGHVNDSILPDAIYDETNRIGWPDRNICERQH